VTLYVPSIITILSANVIVFLPCRSTLFHSQVYCKFLHCVVAGAFALLSFTRMNMNDVKNHLSRKLNIFRTEQTVLKCKFRQRREISSFKIGLPEVHLDNGLNVYKCPEHVIVHGPQIPSTNVPKNSIIILPLTTKMFAVYWAT